MAFSLDHSILALVVVLPLTTACGSNESSTPGTLQTGGNAGSPASGRAGAPAAATGGAGTPAIASGGVVKPGGSAGAAGTAVVAAAGRGGQPSSAAGADAAGSGGSAGAAVAGSAAGSGGIAGGTVAAAGGGSTAGAAGAVAGAGGAAGTAAAVVKPKCKTKPSQVIAIGDSYVNWITHTFPDDLAREAGEKWRMYAVGGCSLGSGGLCMIPPQLDDAIKEDPDIVAALMDGGGNDILIADEEKFPGGGECKDRMDSPTLKVCQDIVATAMAAGEKLMQTAADAGIRDVIYFFYPHIPGGGFGGMNPNPLLDYSLPMARALCEGAEQRTQGKLRCHFLDFVPVFEGHADWFADDGIHENSLGSAVMAKEVVKYAKELCFAQPESSGCCEP